MIGYNEVLKARLHGHPVDHVFVLVMKNPPGYWLAQDAREGIANGFSPTILVEPKDAVSAFDQVAMLDLVVHLMADDQKKGQALFEKIKHTAKRVVLTGEDLFLDTEVAHA